MNIGFDGNRVFLRVYWNLDVGYTAKPPVGWRIDEGPWRRRRGWILSADHKWTYMPDSEVMDMIMALSGSKELTVRVYPFGKNPLETKLHVEGIETVAPPIIKAMNDYWEHLEHWVERLDEIGEGLN